jgi:hypothetical protein
MQIAEKDGVRANKSVFTAGATLAFGPKCSEISQPNDSTRRRTGLSAANASLAVGAMYRHEPQAMHSNQCHQIGE